MVDKERSCPVCKSKELKSVPKADKYFHIWYSGSPDIPDIRVVICADCGCCYDKLI